MKRSTRRIIFFCFILIFLIITPGVLLYATGYSFDWENRHLIKTGSFYFHSTPSGAQIKIDDHPSGKTPSYIGRLNPASYQIEVSKDGFFAWQKNLTIQEQLTTEARNILLIPKKLTVEFISSNVTSTKEYFLNQQEKNAQAQAILTVSSTLKDVLNFTVFENSIYYLQEPNFILYRTDLAGLTKEQISLQSLPKPNKNYEIIISPEQIAVYEPGGKLYLLDRQTKIFNLQADEVQDIEFSSDNEKTLYWTNHEIWVLWFKDVWAQPYRKAGEKELVTRYSDKIIQAIWFAKANEHIIYSVAGADLKAQIKITELDGRDQRNTFDIYSAPNPEIYWNSNDDLFYILTGGNLYSIDLLLS